MHRGYIKIWRKTLDSGLIQMPNALALFVYMLMEATHKPIRYGTVELERGQLVTGRHKLSSELNMSEQTVRTCLMHLIKFDFITSKSTNKFTVYTIVNYSKYQDADSLQNQQDNQQSTNEQPTTNQQLTTIQEHKHIRTKEHKETSATFVLPEFINADDWNLWIKTRKGKKLNDQQKQGYVDKLWKWMQAGIDYESALKDAALAGWQGLHEPKAKFVSRSDRDKDIADQLTGRSNATTFLD